MKVFDRCRLGLMLLFFAVWAGITIHVIRLEMHLSSVDWTPTDGKVLEARVKQCRGGGRRSGPTKFYQLALFYEFEVKGRRYESTNVFKGNTPSFLQAEAQEKAAFYRANRAQTIHFNPDDPTESYVIESSYRGDIVLLGFVTVLFGLGAMLFWMTKREEFLENQGRERLATAAQE